jgi:hypothetical protein
MTAVDARYFAELAARLRIDSITASTSAGRDTPPQACPPATLWPCCSPRHLRHDRANPEGPGVSSGDERRSFVGLGRRCLKPTLRLPP